MLERAEALISLHVGVLEVDHLLVFNYIVLANRIVISLNGNRLSEGGGLTKMLNRLKNINLNSQKSRAMILAMKALFYDLMEGPLSGQSVLWSQVSFEQNVMVDG